VGVLDNSPFVGYSSCRYGMQL